MDSSSSSSSPSEVNNGVPSSPMSVEPVVTSNGNGPAHDSGQTPTTTNMTPEQEEEIKLRMKYPNPQKPGGSTFIQKMLYKGCKKYFDSGDYNMAKSRTKAHVNTNGVSSGPGSNAGQLISQQKISEEHTPNSATHSPVIADQALSNQSRLSTSPQTSSLNSSSLSTAPSSAAVPTPQIEVISTPSSASASNSYHHYNQQQQTPSIHTRLSSTNINNSSPLILFPSSSSSSSSTTSTSTSSLHQMSSLQTSRQLLSSSTSASNIMGAAAAMSVDPVLLNSADEIGHGIPTPECLPQSRKHAISQSKLATPRLSSS